jgi:hypothetical protein
MNRDITPSYYNDWSTYGWWRLRRTSSMKMVAMKLGNTPRPAAWSPPLASFPPPVLIPTTRSSNSLRHLAAAVFWWIASIDWLDPRGGRRRQRQFIEKHLGQRGCRTGPVVGWANRPRPISAQVGPGFLLGCFSHDSLFVCTCMWAFGVVSFMVKAWILAMQASLFSGWVPEDLHVDASVLGSFGVMSIACLDSCQASWSSSKVIGELIPKVSSLA